MHRMNGIVIAAAVAVAGVVVLAPARHADAASRCFGKRPTLVGTNGPDRLIGTNDQDVIVGGAGDDLIKGLDGQDRICAGAGDDRLLAGRSKHADALAGGGGNDLLKAGGDQIGFFGNETLEQDLLVGGPDQDDLRGQTGADFLRPGPGNDRVDGGGAPSFTNGDILDLSFSEEGVHVDLERDIARGQGQDDLAGVEVVYGTPFADSILGSEARNLIDARAGDDILRGAGSRDELFGGPGDDLLAGDSGTDFLVPNEGDDEIDGGPDEDTVTFGDAERRVVVDLPAGTVTGQGADTIAGVENVLGSLFDDLLIGDDNDNELNGNKPGGHCGCKPGNDVIRGGGGSDNLIAGSGNDELYGDDGDDLLEAGTDDDYLDGGAGIDTLRGDPGHDTCVNGEDQQGCEA